MAKKRKSITVEQGPCKTRSAGPPVPRRTTHKVRAAWFQARASYPVREADVENLIEQRGQMPATATAGFDWQLVGPTNTGGRCTALAVHPRQPDTVYIGAAGGGVWRTDDAGKTWTPQWHNQPVLNIGSLAIDPNAPDTVYCGTGEANGSADSYPGVGLFKTKDGGKTWALLASSKKAGLPRRIGAIAIDPFDSKHIIIGGVRHSADETAGMFVSTNSGKSWSAEHFISIGSYWCHSVVFHPKAKGVIFGTFDEHGSHNGIWRSGDGGKNWEHLTKGLPDPTFMGRTSLAIAPSHPDTMYAICAAQSEVVLGVFKSVNRGSSWTDITGNEFGNEGQMTYGNCIVAHPEDPNVVLCGGVDLHLSNDGGKSWKQATHWDADRGTPGYAHADHHALVMPAAKPGRIYDANDGGMDLSQNAGVAWENRSTGLAATMFYDIDVAQSDSQQFGGGAQDNGTVMTSDGKPDDFFEVLGGDGGWMVFDRRDASHFYASYYNFNIFRWRGGNYKDVTPQGLTDAERNSVWMVYILMDPNHPKTVYSASNRMWKTMDDGDWWNPISPVFDGSTITAIEVARANSKYVYAGTEKGGFFRSIDGGMSWSGDLSSTALPGKIITRIETHPKNAKTVLVTVGGTGHSHVFRSDDAGLTWRDSDAGQLPDVPHQAIAYRTEAPDTVFVANDAGVFQSTDGGARWLNISGNLPTTMCIDLVYHDKDKTLTVGTYGRSIWRTSFVG